MKILNRRKVGDMADRRMGLCNRKESSEEIGEPRREKDLICEWERLRESMKHR